MSDSSTNQTIGIFDSGVGGLSVWREVARQLPSVNTVYVADQANMPYGERSLEDLYQICEQIVHYLVDHYQVDIVIIACNTASAAALYRLRQKFTSLPFVGMEPAIKPASEQSETGRVGILATQATFQGQLYEKLAAHYGRETRLLTQIGYGLAEAVENGQQDMPETRVLLQQYLHPLIEAQIDQLVLACTHYPFLIPTIRELLPDQISIIDPAPAVARQAGRLHSLNVHPQTDGRRPIVHLMQTTAEVERFKRIALQVLPQIKNNNHVRFQKIAILPKNEA